MKEIHRKRYCIYGLKGLKSACSDKKSETGIAAHGIARAFVCAAIMFQGKIATRNKPAHRKGPGLSYGGQKG